MLARANFLTNVLGLGGYVNWKSRDYLLGDLELVGTQERSISWEIKLRFKVTLVSSERSLL